MSCCGMYLKQIRGGQAGALSVLAMGCLVLAMGCLVFAAGCNGSTPLEERMIGAGIIPLRLPDTLGPLQRPVVEFDHPKHTAALKQKGCTACHLEDQDGKLSAKMGRLEDGADRTALMELYHQRCLGCHTEQAQQKQPTGPLACGECHRQQGKASSSWEPSTFDYALHDRHIKATKETADTCGTCHTTYDEQKKEMVYQEGVAGGAGDYHGAKDAPTRAALRKVAHQTCIGCHLKNEQKSLDSGPTGCEGCHAQRKEKEAPKTKVIAKIVSNQPEWSWIHAPGATSALVAFDHKGHAQEAPFCSTCHHQTVRACKDCHTLTGDKKGGGVTLEMAYHAPGATQSCVGCHSKVLQQQDCAGCHAQIRSSASDSSCKTCHGGPMPVHREGKITLPTSMPGVYPIMPELAELPAASEAFPEEVIIDGLVDKYQASKFPHRKIVARLDQAARKSTLASRFHGSAEVLCSGCHHHSPVGERPPPCKSCHLDQAHSTKDKPSLKVAYHRQCLGCHQQMKLPQTGCTDCHAKADKRPMANTRDKRPEAAREVTR